MKRMLLSCGLLLLAVRLCGAPVEVPRYEVYELGFTGKRYTVKENPVRDIVLLTQWRHESGRSYTVYGFYDGDGAGAASGNVFKVRFTPTETGVWRLVSVVSNDSRLNGQHAGLELLCTPSDRKGFWIPEKGAASGRWYRRSDGSHPYVIGNTMYSFLTETNVKGGDNGSSIERDVVESGKYFNKLRFAVGADLNPNPEHKPFLDADGNPTDDGAWSHRPNPEWFAGRVDKAVALSYERDLIADMILNGPDVEASRNNLRARENGGDATPFLRYIAARYGSYPNVWFCLSNEFDIRTPRFTPDEIVALGVQMRAFMPYPTPLSVHANQHDWYPELNTTPGWNDHVIVQYKLRTLPEACDLALHNFYMGGGNMPVVNDELAYQGKGDKWSEADVVEAFLGAFMGGAYASTAYKSGSKLGNYFEGDFDAEEHTAADNLRWMREKIERNVTFWRMEPIPFAGAETSGVNIFRDGRPSFRHMAWPGHEYLLATDRSGRVSADLPEGTWTVVRFDLIKMEEKVVATDASGEFRTNAPDSRAVLWLFKKN